MSSYDLDWNLGLTCHEEIFFQMQWKHNKYPLILFENVYYEKVFLKTMSSIFYLDCDKGDLYRNTVDIVAKIQFL